MVRDGVANIVDRLRERGLDPRRVGHDSWEARCPVHRSADHALAITRNELNHVILECRGTQNCQYSRIIGALGLTNDRVYADTSDWLISRLSRVPIEAVSLAGSISCEAALASAEDSSGAPSSQACSPQGATSPCDQAPGNSAELAVSIVGIEKTAAPPEQAPGYPVQLSGFDPPVNAAAGDNLDRLGPIPLLLRVASGAQFFRSPEGRLFAQVPVDSRHDILGLNSAAFRDWLIKGYFADRGEIPSPAAIRRVLTALEARARFEGGTPSVFVRVGHDGSGSASLFFIDLGDSSGRAIKIGSDGWSVVDRPGLHFRRPDGLLALPTPSRDGSLELLRSYVNLTDRDFRLMIAWMAAALRPVGPYPILALYGEQAAAKSTLATVVRLLIDPQEAPLLALPRGTRNLMVTGYNRWLLAYDNISVIPDLLSDGLCMVSTGGAYAGRALFSNDESSVIHVQRPVLLSGIEEFVRRGDLGDRTVYLNLPSIDDDHRRREEHFWPAFHQDRPKILGGLLDAVAGGLRELPTTHLPKLPRMADFAAFGEAVGRTLGWPTGMLLADYNDNRREATVTQLEESLVGTVLLEKAHDMADWTGTPSHILQRLSSFAGKKLAASARWPKSPAWLTSELKRIAPQLRMHGISVEFCRTHQGRVLKITKPDRRPKNVDTPNSI